MRLAYYLAVHTVQQQTDILALGRNHFDGNKIALTQSKTGKLMWVPCHEALRKVLIDRLAEMRPDQTAFLATRSGGPMDEEYLRTSGAG